MGLCAFTAEGAGSIPGQELRFHKLERHSQKKKKERRNERFWEAGEPNLKVKNRELEQILTHPHITIYVFLGNLY